MLYRVANLSKSGDKRIQDFGWFTRQRGVVGEIEPVSNVLGEQYGGHYNDLFFLTNKFGENIGLYRIEELEEVTEKQLLLETVLNGLLTVFPNKNPSTVLDVNTTDEIDGLAIESIVPALRRILKKEFSLEFLKAKQDSGF